MNGYARRPQQWIGTLLLGLVLLFGAYGVVVNAREGEAQQYIEDEVYVEECGACHLAYPPGLLPVQSWQGIMLGLADHFGENAELDVESVDYLSRYFQREALREGQPSTLSQLLRNMPDDPPLRITELPAFVHAHDLVARQLQIEEFKEGFLSPCADCHRQAADARFEKELLHPGYGPQVWGRN